MQLGRMPATGDAILASLPRATRRILDAALEGHTLRRDEAIELLQDEGPQVYEALLAVADVVRTRHKGTRVTYSPKVFLPVTNLCLDRCSYCTFRADPDDPHAWTMLPEEIRAVCRSGRALGCTEALMCLGDRPERVFPSYRATLKVLGARSTVDYLLQACQWALDEGLFPHTNAGLLNREELLALRPLNPSMGLMLENVSPRLRGKGQAHWHAPDKDPAKRLAMIELAGELRIPFTSGILLGIGETREEVVDSLLALIELHRRYGHIQEIIIQNFRAKPTTRMATAPEPTTMEIAKTLAVARLLAPDMNLQVPPNLNPYDHRILLRAGLNDWGGISPLTPDFVNPEAPWPHLQALRELCQEAGFTLEPRLPIYAEYIDKDEFIHPALRPRLRDKGIREGEAKC